MATGRKRASSSSISLPHVPGFEAYDIWIQGEIFSPVNGFIIVFNVLFFLGVLLIFFWYVLSSQFQTIVLDKVDIITLMATYDENIKTSVTNLIQTINTEELKAAAQAEQIARNTTNQKGFVESLLGWFIVLGVLTLIAFIMLCIHAVGGGINKGDWVLIFLLVLSFVTEIIFYFVVVDSWEFIGDYQLFKALFANH